MYSRTLGEDNQLWERGLCMDQMLDATSRFWFMSYCRHQILPAPIFNS